MKKANLVLTLTLAAACIGLCTAVKAADGQMSAGRLAARQRQIDQNPLPADLAWLDPTAAPSGFDALPGALYSLMDWPFGAPYPLAAWRDFPGVQLYYSPSLANNIIYMDDTAYRVLKMAAQAASDEPPPTPGGTNGFYYNDTGGGTCTPQMDLSTNFTDLYLEIRSASAAPPDVAALVLHNTSPLAAYLLTSRDSLTSGTWEREQVVIGAEGTNTPTRTFIGTRTNELFLWAHTLPATNVGVVVTLGSGTTCWASVNDGATNQHTAFTDTLVGFSPPIYSLNLGYGGDDYTGIYYDPEPATHMLRHWDNFDQFSTGPHLGSQDAVGIAFSSATLSTLSNLFLARNPIGSLDVHGSTGLRMIESYACPNLEYVSVTNCPNLERACFETCPVRGDLDFTGDGHLHDIRAALTQITGVVFGAGSGPDVWHLCLRDNPQLHSLGSSLAALYSLRECYLWGSNQQWPITSGTMPSTNLYDVEIYSNRFEYVNFAGQSNLTFLWAQYNNLTNAVLTGCSSLYEVLLNNNQLGSNALDNILTALDALYPHVPYTVDLRYNAEYPSTSVGWQHYTNLLASSPLKNRPFPRNAAENVCYGPLGMLPASPTTSPSPGSARFV